MLVVFAKEEACRAARSHPVAKPSLTQLADSAPAWHWISTIHDRMTRSIFVCAKGLGIPSLQPYKKPLE